jgi:Tfp pilus assembly protein FimT
MNNESSTKQLKGFSLLEVVLTIGILLVISIVVFPVALNKTQQTRLETYASELVTDIYFQQQRSFLKDVPSGVLVQGNGYVLFDGEDYSTALEVDTKSLPPSISIHSISLTTGNEIRFQSGEFKPSVYGSMILTDGNFSVRVYINQEGLIAYERI